MKRILFFVFFINSILSTHAQSSTYYNYQGDQALQNNDYEGARSWFSEGLDSCDRYSIKKLAEIWIDHQDMRESMKLPMLKCKECMEIIVESRDPDIMYLNSQFYRHGIGTPPDTILANYWYREYAKSLKTIIDSAPENVYSVTDSSTHQTPKKSNRFYSFLAYTYSPTMPFGFTAGIYFDKIGVYVSYRTDSQSIDAEYDCNNTKVPVIAVEDPPYEFFNPGRWHSRMITGGILYPLVKNRIFLSLGGGYGERYYYREIQSLTDQNFSIGGKYAWCLNTEASYKGFTFEGGGMFVWKRLIVLGGVNSTRFLDLDIYLGLGLNF